MVKKISKKVADHKKKEKKLGKKDVTWKSSESLLITLEYLSSTTLYSE
jgi:hypothetical protein